MKNFNISGNFDTSEREVSVVKKLFTENGIKFKSVTKYENANAGDILVVLENGKKIVIEVKEEKIDRFEKYGDLGIDLMSVFQFKDPSQENFWKGPPKPGNLVVQFFNDIDKDAPLKKGKISYSKSDLWLFFTVDHQNKISYYSFFSGEFMTSTKFKIYLRDNCVFAVNNKPDSQLSHNDTFHSAVFFINHNDRYLKNNEFDLKLLNKKDPSGNDPNAPGGFGLS